MKKWFILLSIFMGFIVLISNFLVQYPVKHFGLSKILTYGAFTYPIAFLITDLTNRFYGKFRARKIVYIGFFIGVLFTLFISTNFEDSISIRIAIGSGTAFLISQLVDINIFDRLRSSSNWFVPPLLSSFGGSLIDTFLFFSISFYGTDVPWIQLSLGDFAVKIFVAIIMLIPFKVLIMSLRDVYLYKNL